ncbi:PKD domain-containing protein [Candidatus Bathyarchaeota archaeon]|nr:PKD domain-containing protein [Candidatus Bathyarchaeota archaeon]
MATVTFKAISQAGEPDLPFSCELVLNDTQLINDVMGENPHTMSHGSYEIEPLSFSYEPSNPIAGQPVLFTAPEAIYSVIYSWSFGDGTSLNTTEPTAGHMYSMLGEYNVTLTCMTDGLASSVSKPIAIWPQGTAIEVTVDVGSIHFGGEIAEFNVLTTNYGETVNASITEALLYHNSGFYADLTGLVQSVSTGLHTIPYSIPIAAETGTYTLVVKAEHYNAQGASMKSFQISQTLASWGTIITQIDNDIATIMTNLNYINLNLTAIDARLTSIIADIAIIDTEVGVLQTSVDNIDARLVDIEGDIAIIDSKLGAIQANVSDINARLVSIEGDIAVIDSAIGTIQTDLSSIDATVTEVEGDMATISTTVGEVDTKLDGVQATATTTLYAASILSAIAAILSAIILMTTRKR